MQPAALAPVALGKSRSLGVLLGLVSDPMGTTRRLHEEHGPFVVAQYPHSRRDRPQFLGFIADAGLYRTMFSNAEAWRNVNVNVRISSKLAAARLTVGMTRLRGARHAHYRRLLATPLSKPAVAAMSPEMAAIAQRNVGAWPDGKPVDLLPLTEHLMQDLAIGLLFGDDRERALPITKMIALATAASWPLPSRAWASWLRAAPKLERAIVEWANEKRGELNPKDILSILANNPDEQGQPASGELIAGILLFTFGAAYETCMNALAWALVLLTQFPEIAARLTDEIDGALGGGPPTMDRIGELPLLDGVTKEAMRLFPPVPLQFRRSLIETDLGAARIPARQRVLASAYLINRNPEVYPEPYRFHPERWRSLDPSPYDYTVFGAGGRMCPGFLFGYQMVKIGLAAILSKHRIELAPGTRIDHRSTITLSPYPNVPIILHDKRSKMVATPVSGRIRELVDLPAVH